MDKRKETEIALGRFRGDFFYHGTKDESYEDIMNGGLRWDPTCERRCGIHLSGSIGRGIYLTRSVATAIAHGNHLLKVGMQTGTRIMDAAVPPDQRMIKNLKRKYGSELLKRGPLYALPCNKNLSLEETTALVRYQWRRTYAGAEWRFWKWRRKWEPEMRLLKGLKPLLTRYGFHGFGDPHGPIGIVVFDETRLRVAGYIGACPSGFEDDDFSQVPVDEVEALFAMPEGRAKTLRALEAGACESRYHHAAEIKPILRRGEGPITPKREQYLQRQHAMYRHERIWLARMGRVWSLEWRNRRYGIMAEGCETISEKCV